ncbi:MAG: CDP-alcohol phosphatidyltransferase family protein [Acidothermales bacterium]|nr:CDP-alcohol phosphatidyltransferase family protein [Acidothermales bacterium]
MRTVRLETVFGALATPALLGVLLLTTGLGVAGWIVGLAAGWTTTALLACARARTGRAPTTPADWVTLTRALLTAGVAGLVADSFFRPTQTVALVALASVALALDAVDGQVARRTGTASPLGGRFDGEVDAFLILVLSVEVSRTYGAWALAIGVIRYALLVAGWLVPWLAATLPQRYWRKPVTAVQGIVLTAAASGLLPRTIGVVAVVVAMALLAESFGRDIVWLYRNGADTLTRRILRTATAVTAIAVVWAVLVAPDRLDQLTPAAFVRIPVEGVVLVGLAVVLPTGARRVVSTAAGTAFGLLTIVKVFDMISYAEFNRPFNPLLDWSNVGAAVGVVRDSLGSVPAGVVPVLLGLVLALVVAVVTVCAVRLAAAAAEHRRGSVGATAVLGMAWVVCAAMSLQLVPGAPIASTSTAGLAAAQASEANATVHDEQRFDAAMGASDPYARMPVRHLLTGLRGKDVIVVFVESYGQVAVRGTPFSHGVDDILRSGTASLTGAGFSARSAYLDSSTFGGISWLAHSTLQSGLWVDSQQRYDQLVRSNRFTLAAAFGKAGWRTVSDIPSDKWAWPAGRSFYHYDALYDRRNVGYHGPTFSYASMPDQYTLAAFQQRELAPGHRPLMAEIDLVSSHVPWTPLPHMVPWDELGDGSVFGPMPAQGLPPDVAWRNPDTVRRLYAQSIRYSVRSLVSWVSRLHDDNLVLVMLGDHQPGTSVSGTHANHQVPVSVVAKDPAVFSRIASWRWRPGLLPSPTGPVWPMDAFRDRFFTAFD